MRAGEHLATGVLALLAVAVPALAGPNAGGTIFCHDAGLTYTRDQYTYCGVGAPPADCATADTEIDGATHAAPAVWKVYAAFPDSSYPRVKGIAWGIHYDPAIVIMGYGTCVEDSPCPSWGCDEHDYNWPDSDTGDTTIWQQTRTTTLVEVYWFAGYTYGGETAIFHLRDNPGLGGLFGDDSNPPALDPIAGYGSIGFGRPGPVACPQNPVPVQTATWGRTKSIFK